MDPLWRRARLKAGKGPLTREISMLQVTLQTPGQLVAADAGLPTAAAGEALVRVHRVGVCGTDLHAFRGRQPFFSYPRVLGHELGVEVVEPGGSGEIRRGDRCAVEPYLNCGSCIACRTGRPNCCTSLSVLGVHQDGGMREVIAVPARKLHRSDRLSYEQLALVETLAIGAHAVERATLEPGEFALVIGAGPIGVSVVQFARAAGAKVAVVDTSTARLDLCRRLWKVDCTIDGRVKRPKRRCARRVAATCPLSYSMQPGIRSRCAPRSGGPVPEAAWFSSASYRARSRSAIQSFTAAS